MAARFLVVVAFLIERDGCLLMLRRSATKDHGPGEWEPGSGRVEAGETPIEAVHREAREEAIGIAFHCRARAGEVRLSAEHDAARWVPRARLGEVEVSEPLRTCLASFARRR